MVAVGEFAATVEFAATCDPTISITSAINTIAITYGIHGSRTSRRARLADTRRDDIKVIS